ncbi:MAG: amino acid permease-associated region [Jatrophihabitans sp.]|nr:amino acid permease-associated region [Jatrophihabitans sp.]
MTSAADLTTGRATALYVGALLGPSVLLLPGLAASLAGPASILAWSGLLVVSGLLAWIFSSLGTRLPGRGGVAAYTAAAFGPRAERAVTWCFLGGVSCGAPVVCLIGAAYVSRLLGGGHLATVLVATVLLVAVVALTLGGARASSTAQLVLVAVLIALIALAVVGSAPQAKAANWHPFAPHGWTGVGHASSVLMLSFVGWEAIAPLTARLHDPRRQLPRVITAAFVITSAVYLSLSVATIAVLGRNAGSPVPVADLLHLALGRAGGVIAAAAAIALTLAATNAYLTGAAEMVAGLRGQKRASERAAGSRRLQLGVAAAGVVLLGAAGAGLVTTAELVALPTAMFLTVYVGCTAAAARVLTGPVRSAAVLACAAVLLVLAFSGWAPLLALAVVAAAVGTRARPAGYREPAAISGLP